MTTDLLEFAVTICVVAPVVSLVALVWLILRAEK